MSRSGNVPDTPQANTLDRLVVRRAGGVTCGNTSDFLFLIIQVVFPIMHDIARQFPYTSGHTQSSKKTFVM
jgi:hypothetical protein